MLGRFHIRLSVFTIIFVAIHSNAAPLGCGNIYILECLSQEMC